MLLEVGVTPAAGTVTGVEAVLLDTEENKMYVTQFFKIQKKCKIH